MKRLMGLLGEKYVIDILTSLDGGPKRYTDLKAACPVDRTLTEKLRKLQDAGLITAEARIVGKKPMIHYTLSEKGGIVVKDLAGMFERIKDE